MTEEEMIKRYQYLVPIIARPYFLAGAEAEDLQQEGRIGLLYGIRTYKALEGVQFSTYACRCIRNQILKAVAKSVSGNSSVLTKAESLENIDVADISGEVIVDTAYYKALLKKSLKDVSPLERQVIELYLQGFSYREIGEKLSLSAKTVDNIIQKIRKK